MPCKATCSAAFVGYVSFPVISYMSSKKSITAEESLSLPGRKALRTGQLVTLARFFLLIKETLIINFTGLLWFFHADYFSTLLLYVLLGSWTLIHSVLTVY